MSDRTFTVPEVPETNTTRAAQIGRVVAMSNTTTSSRSGPCARLSCTIDPVLVGRLRRVTEATKIPMSRIIEDGLRARLPELERVAAAIPSQLPGVNAGSES
jgi:hypothetical protein